MNKGSGPGVLMYDGRMVYEELTELFLHLREHGWEPTLLPQYRTWLWIDSKHNSIAVTYTGSSKDMVYYAWLLPSGGERWSLMHLHDLLQRLPGL